MRKNQIALIVLIVVLGFILRFLNLSSFPSALHRDEAFLGYNAFSILKTGKDMTGDLLPLHFKSFLYSPGGYSYFSLPFIAVFGLNEFSIRAASAFFGTLSIGALFLLVRELLHKRKESFTIAAFSSFLFAILPWHINLSRTATENVLVVFFLLIGTLVYIRWTRTERGWLFVGAFVSFVITLFLYQAPRSFLPFYIPLLILCFAIKKKKHIIGSTVLYLLFIIIPILFILLSPSLALRIKTVSIFSTEQTQLVINEQITQEAVQGVATNVSRIFHNKVIGYSSAFIKNYFDHFSYDFLFTENSLPDRYRVPLNGILYLIMLPFIVIGIHFLFSRNKKLFFFIGTSILLTPVGSSLAFDDVPNLQRTLFMAPLLCVCAAIGFWDIYNYFKNSKVRFGIIFICTLALAFSFVFYLRQYYLHMPVYRPWFRNDGYRDLVRVVNENKSEYKSVVITNRESAPTVFFLLYSQYDPGKFHEQTKNISTHDFDRVSFGPYTFVTDECPLTEKMEGDERYIVGEKGVLYVNSSLCNTIEESKVIDTIKRRDGSEVFHITIRK